MSIDFLKKVRLVYRLINSFTIYLPSFSDGGGKIIRWTSLRYVTNIGGHRTGARRLGAELDRRELRQVRMKVPVYPSNS
jgi:hypothetical protein